MVSTLGAQEVKMLIFQSGYFSTSCTKNKWFRYCLSRQLAKAKEGGKEMKCLKCKKEINLAAAGGGAGRRRRDESPNRGGRRDEEEHGGGMSQVDEGAGPSGTQGRRKRISRPATDSDSD